MKALVPIASFVLLLGLVASASAAPEALDGFSGIVIWIFLGYCAIVIVAQVFAALSGLRRILDDLTARKTQSKRIWLR